jgi:3-phosphoshikimate 1-carboxyvinyltransferase
MSAMTFQPPEGLLNASISVPGSKSIANRALICALLAEGDSRITGLPDGDDTAVILDVLDQMKRLTKLDDSVIVSGSRTVRMPGIIDAKLAGTSSRFLTAVASLGVNTCVIDGGAPLRSRPMSDLHEALSSMGAHVHPLGEPGHLPVSVEAGQLIGGRISIRGDVSSQFISALMLIGPMLDDGLIIEVSGDLVSRSYVAMTAAVMKDFGATVTVKEAQIVVAPGGYSPCEFSVEPDFSSAAFPLSAVVLRQGTIRIPGLTQLSLQGDAEIGNILSAMGCSISASEGTYVVTRAEVALSGISVNMADCSDLVPAVAVAMLFAKTQSQINGVGFIRKKESDRLGDLAHELQKIGAEIEVQEDGLLIEPLHNPQSAVLDTHHDHRLAMAFSLLSLAVPGVEISDPSVVSKSWPSYFVDMAPILGTKSAQH